MYAKNNNYFIDSQLTDIYIGNIKYTNMMNFGNLTKESHGISADASIYILPFYKIFINYIHRESKLKFDYTINKIYNVINSKNNTYNIKEQEDIINIGNELRYEHKIKDKYLPYISSSVAFGITASSLYENLLLNFNINLKTGTIFILPKDMTIDVWVGANYSTINNPNGYIINITDSIDNNLSFNTNIEYKENTDKNIDIMTGFSFSPQKNINLSFDIKFLNNLIITTGLTMMF